MNYATPLHVDDVSTCMFYHTMELPGYGRQVGQWDLTGRFRDYIGNADLTGKRVLDIGCGSGFLSFSAEAAGASEVISFDMDNGGRQHLLPFQNKDYYSNYPVWMERQTASIKRWHNAYWLAHRALQSKAKVCYGDVYDLPSGLGAFDVVIVGAILEHLADPIRALASIARRCSDLMIINTELDGIMRSEEPLAKFLGRANNPDADYVFWMYSLGTFREVLAMLGFEIVRLEDHTFRYEIANGEFSRTAIVARRIRS